MSFLTSLFIALHLGWAALSRAHVVITYPGWRGNNLLRNEAFPKGMQWESPCTYQSTASSLSSNHNFGPSYILTLGFLQQVVASRSQQTVHNGLSTAAPLPFNRAGSPGTSKPQYSSTWGWASRRMIQTTRGLSPSSTSPGLPTIRIRVRFVFPCSSYQRS